MVMVVVVISSNGNGVLGTGGLGVDGIGVVGDGDGVVDEDEVDRN